MSRTITTLAFLAITGCTSSEFRLDLPDSAVELDTATDVTPGVSASAETNAALARCAVSGTKLTTEWEREGANGDVVMATSTVSNVLVIANSDGVVEA